MLAFDKTKFPNKNVIILGFGIWNSKKQFNIPPLFEIIEGLRSAEDKIKKLLNDFYVGTKNLIGPVTLREVEAHIVTIHLQPTLLQGFGIPIYDLTYLKSINAYESIKRVRDCVFATLRECDRIGYTEPTYRNYLVRTLQFIDQIIPCSVDWEEVKKEFPYISVKPLGLTAFETLELAAARKMIQEKEERAKALELYTRLFSSSMQNDISPNLNTFFIIPLLNQIFNKNQYLEK